MGNSSSAPKASAQDKAILDLKLQRDRLHQYSRRLALSSTSYQTAARHALLDANKPAALLALRQKKYQESLLQKTDQQLQQLELVTQDVEFALVQRDVYFGLRQGAEVLKEIRREMGGLESVERLVGRSEEEVEFQREVGELLKGRLARGEEEEVEDELEKLERESRQVEGEKLPGVPQQRPEQVMPDAPVEEPVGSGGEADSREEERRKPELVPA
ncbi:MAG: Vacuolar protein sorting-associated protein 20 [Chrysothrix sp. TS-e1954]|nr:MAG: Vacuolar protein sorting-associated protein 20 [Chrysothrix sp. TS-e1954]